MLTLVAEDSAELPLRQKEEAERTRLRSTSLLRTPKSPWGRKGAPGRNSFAALEVTDEGCTSVGSAGSASRTSQEPQPVPDVNDEEFPTLHRTGCCARERRGCESESSSTVVPSKRAKKSRQRCQSASSTTRCSS